MGRIFIAATAISTILTFAMAGCTSAPASGESVMMESDAAFETSDLSLFELHNRVKRVTKTTYYNVTPHGDSVVIDTAAINRLVTTIYFDSLGNYVTRRYERLRRDSAGRITRWEDRKPNLGKLHGGFLRDTLGYEHINQNVVLSNGMGDFAVTVYDDNHNIVGQYTDPVIDGEHTACFNIYRDFDVHGNWTKRITVWTTQQPGERPHISYSAEERDIIYYTGNKKAPPKRGTYD